MARLVYDNNLAFGTQMGEALDTLKERIETKKASMLIIDGGVGEGKTTLAVQCADYIQGSLINFKNQLANGGVEFQEKLQICHTLKLKVLIYDEAGDFSRKSAITQFNRQIIRVFETFRAYKIIIILVLPNFGYLDASLLKMNVPRFLINCYGRSKTYGKYRVYSLYRMFYVRKNMDKLTIPSVAYNLTTPNFRGQFLNLPKDREKELEKFSVSAKLEILSDNILKAKGLFNGTQICRKIGMSKIWYYKKLKELKIKPEYVYKRQKYYSADVVDRLMEMKKR